MSSCAQVGAHRLRRLYGKRVGRTPFHARHATYAHVIFLQFGQLAGKLEVAAHASLRAGAATTARRADMDDIRRVHVTIPIARSPPAGRAGTARPVYFVNVLNGASAALYTLHCASFMLYTPLSLHQFSTALSVHMLMFDMNQPPSQGSSSGSSGNHQPCWAETTWGMMPESSLAR